MRLVRSSAFALRSGFRFGGRWDVPFRKMVEHLICVGVQDLSCCSVSQTNQGVKSNKLATKQKGSISAIYHIPSDV